MKTVAMESGLPAATLVVCLALALMFSAPPAAAQEIYRVVDEDGNVTYTDRKPDDGSEAMDLPELNVVEPGKLGDPEVAGVEAPTREAREEAPTLTFRITSPGQEETIWNTAMQLPVQLELGVDLPPGAQIVIFLDGQPRQSTQSTSTTLEGVERGPHELRAELQTASGRVLATTEPVTFFMRQQSALHPRPG